MAGTRAYRRNSRGQFAGAEGGTHVTFGRAGGFASAAHRANVANSRAAKARRRALARKGVRVASTAATVGAAAVIAGVAAKRI